MPSVKLMTFFGKDKLFFRPARKKEEIYLYLVKWEKVEKARCFKSTEIGNEDRQYDLQFLCLTGNLLPLGVSFFYFVRQKHKKYTSHYSVGSSYSW